MILETNTTERKKLAHALAVHLGTDATYLGPPSFAYRVGAITIERDGKLVGEDLEPLKPFLVDEGFLDEEEDSYASDEQTETDSTATQDEPEDIEEASEQPQNDPPPTDEQTADDPTATQEQEESEAAEEPSTDSEATPEFLEVGFPSDSMTAEQVRNLINMLYSKQYLLGRSVGTQTIRISDAVVARFQEHCTMDDCIRLIDDFRASDDLQGIKLNEHSVSLAFPYVKADAPDYDLYLLLARRIVDAAKTAQRVKAELQQPENEKYFMRGWLLRLGFGGSQHKEIRKRLMQDLKGCSAFATDAEAQKHREKYAELRRAAREVFSNAE